MADESSGRMSRRRSSNETSRQSALAQLAALKSDKDVGNASRRIDNFQLKLQDNLYDEVNEQEYATLVAKRKLEASSFVVGEDSLGYGDIGEDELELEDDDVILDNSRVKPVASGSKTKRKTTSKISASLSAAASLLKGSKVTSMFTSTSNILSNAKNKQTVDSSIDSVLDDLVAEVTADDTDRERIKRRRKGMGIFKPSSYGTFSDSSKQTISVFAESNFSSGNVASQENKISDNIISSNKDKNDTTIFHDTKNDKKEIHEIKQKPPAGPNSDSQKNELSKNAKNSENGIRLSKENSEKNRDKLQINDKINQISQSNSNANAIANENANVLNAKVNNRGKEENASIGWKNVSQNEIKSKSKIDFRPQNTDSSFSLSENPLPLNEDGKLLFYFLDAYEDSFGASPGTVYLFGKVYSQGQFLSCCIVVKDIKRCIFAIPEENIFNDNEVKELEQEIKNVKDSVSKSKESTDETKLQDAKSKLTRKLATISLKMKEEITEVLLNKNVNLFTIYPVKRSYAFERVDIPKGEFYCLKIKYPFTYPPLPIDFRGKTFTSLLGTNTSALEHFLIKRKIMGPCWLSISNANQVAFTSRLSHCKLEAIVNNPKDIKIHFSEKNVLHPPPLTVASLHIKTVINHSQNQNMNEIVALSILYCKNVKVDQPMADSEWNTNEQLKHFSIVRKLDGGYFPHNFDKEVNSINEKVGSNVLSMKGSERELLSLFLAKILSIDPDVLVGHGISAFDLEILLHRMKIRKVGNWSSIGRVKRSQMPNNLFQKHNFGPNFNVLNCLSGRLFCDTSVSSKELLKETSFSLTSLSESQLGIVRKEISPSEILNSFKTSSDLIQMIQLTETDAWLQFKLFFHLNILPLSRQLTNISGNLWNKTLQGARAQRIEYLLIHEFHSKKFIVPDKLTEKEKEKMNKISNLNKKSAKSSSSSSKTQTNESNEMIILEEEEVEEDMEQDLPFIDDEISKSKNRKKQAAYAGGLVLEPKKGFYDKIVLLLDFNSLYPSIIQEFNICFTTVERSDGENFPSLPEAREMGILPQVLKTLVQRRSQVKKMLKKETNPIEKKQLDIRQQALKLTANSMYGCLGYTKSRFYAKPLAELITSQGRDILQKTVNLVESSLNLQVIYGDTDSIMIYSGIDDIEEAIGIGNKVKKEVNKHYKLLEIELDAIYLRMLLLKKKKYAAIKLEKSNDGTFKELTEKKGIDIVRRDWSLISKDVGNFCLDQILSKSNRESVVETIHEYLRQIAEQMNKGEIDLEKFVISKSLTKNPDEYADAKTQPHVQVALRRRQNGCNDCNSGDTIPYVICENNINDSEGIAARAYHIEEIKKNQNNFKIDIAYYLSQQIHPVVSRLCEDIEGTDSAKIAFCLGLDASKFNKHQHRSHFSKEDDTFSLGSFLNNDERYKYCTPILLTCPECCFPFPFLGVNSFVQNEKNFFKLSKNENTPTLPIQTKSVQAQPPSQPQPQPQQPQQQPQQKPQPQPQPQPQQKPQQQHVHAQKQQAQAQENEAEKKDSAPEKTETLTETETEIQIQVNNPLQCPKCQNSNHVSCISAAMLANQVKLQGEKFICKYYEGWMKCDEPTCDATSRNVTLRMAPDHAEGATCPNYPRCIGQMQAQFSEADLYTQLAFFCRQLDAFSASEKIEKLEDRKKFENRISPFGSSLEQAWKVAKSLRDKCKYRWIDLGHLFSSF